MTTRRTLSSTVVVGVVAAVVVAGLGVDAAIGPATPVPPAATEVPRLAGSSTCSALSLDDASAVTVASVAAPTEGEDASASLLLEQDGDVRPLQQPSVDGGAAATSVAGDGRLAGLTVRWEEAPLLLARRWEVDGSQRVPGAVEGPCPAEPATTWVVPGVITAGGAAAGLFIANPTDGPASLAVTFTTPDGPVTPTRLANIAVPAHGQVALDLNEFIPEEPDLGVVVRTRSGRVVAEVAQTLEAAVGGVDGRSLVAATATTAETWTVPWVRASDVESAWVWVTNPGEEATDVRLVLHTADGPVVPPDSGVTLPPGTTRRIDLRGALAEVEGSVGVTVRSAPGVPIAAAGGVLRSVEESAERGGIAVVQAVEATAGAHAGLSATGGAGRAALVAITNPGEEPADVEVRVTGHSVASATTVAGLTIAPGAHIEVALGEALPDEGGWAVLVDVLEGVAAATLVTADDEGPLNLTASAVLPFPVTVEVVEPTVVADHRLLHPLRPAPDLDPSDEGEPDGADELDDEGS